MKLKHILALLMCALIISVATACSTSSGNEENTPVETLEYKPIDEKESESTEEAEKSDAVALGEYSASNYICYEANDITISFDGVRKTLWDEPCAVFNIENDSDTNVVISSLNVLVNGIADNSAVFYTDCYARETKKYEVVLSEENFSENVTDISLKFEIKDTEGNLIDSASKVTVKGEGNGIGIKPNGTSIFSSGNINIDYIKTGYSEYVPSSVSFFAINSGEEDIDIRIAEIKINGAEITSDAHAVLMADSSGKIMLNLTDDDLKKAKIKSHDEIITIEGSVIVTDFYTWKAIGEKTAFNVKTNNKPDSDVKLVMEEETSPSSSEASSVDEDESSSEPEIDIENDPDMGEIKVKGE